METQVATELDLDAQQAITRLDEAISQRKRCKGDSATDAEMIICIETRSLVVVFKDLTLWSNRLDLQLAKVVGEKLRESRDVLSADKQCITSVSRRVAEFEFFVKNKSSQYRPDREWKDATFKPER